MIWPFENDTSAITRKIASSKLKYEKLKKRITIFAIALATMLMSTVLLLISGIATVNKNGGNSITGSYHALISGVDKEDFENIQTKEQVILTGLTASIGTSKVGNSRLNISYANSDALILNGLSVEDGKMPESEHEILIEKDYLTHLGVDAGIGDTIPIFMPDTKKETEFIISGYLETAATGNDRTLYAAIVSEQYFNAQDGWEKYAPSVLIRVNTGVATSKEDIKILIREIIRSAGIEKEASINEAYINLSKPSVFLIGTAIAGLAIIIAAGVLVIYCIFYIAIINSIKEYGQLRTIGMTGRQIKRLVFREGFSLSVISIPIGLAAGTFLSYLLVPQGFQFTSLLWIWPFVTALIYLTVRLSIKKPAVIAATVSPIDAYRYSGLNTEKEKHIVRSQRISPIMLAKKHLLNSKRKNALTITSLVLTGVLLIGSSSILSSINAEDMSLSGFPRGQFQINISDELLRSNSLEQVQTANPFANDLQDSLSNISGVEYITAYHYLPVSVDLQAPESDADIVSFSREDMGLIQSCVVDGKTLDYDNLAANNQIIIGRPDSLEKYLNIRAKVGQTITLKVFDGTTSYNMDFEIGAVLNESKIGNNSDKIDMLMLPLDSMNLLASCDTTYQYAVRVSDDLEEQAENELEQILREIPELSFTSLSGAVAQNENFLQGMKMALIVAVAFIGCFAVMNLMNTILTGIITRKKEFALMRSVGMSQKQLFAMVRYEGLIIATIGLLLSLIIGGAVGNILCSILQNGIMSYLKYQFPFGIAMIYCISVILCTFVVTGITLGHQNKVSLIDQLHQ
ncbi:MAG: ABC transporter permease [Lachnospiraceae bacterium]|nr:ABC transporter permease [Lachnospiraceae bacterium]